MDELLKREFDSYREKGKPHPYMVSAGIAAVPAKHPDLDVWRQNFKGVQHQHAETTFIITGAIDDLWIREDGRYIVADYKATAKNGEVNINAPSAPAHSLRSRPRALIPTALNIALCEPTL